MRKVARILMRQGFKPSNSARAVVETGTAEISAKAVKRLFSSHSSKIRIARLNAAVIEKMLKEAK